MNRLIALFYFVLSLVGFDIAGSSIEHRTMADGTQVLLSRTHVQAGVARFDCVDSASGECHYLVLPRTCDRGGTGDAGADCRHSPIARFALAKGESHQVPGLQQFRVCVGPRDEPSGPACEATVAVAHQGG